MRAKKIESTITISKKNNTEREFSHFQFKVPHRLWSAFKIKSIEDNSPTYRETLIELIKNYVGWHVWENLSRIPNT